MDNLLENIRNHLPRTIIFCLLIAMGLTFFFAFSHDQTIRMVMLGIVTLSYITWGLVHHHIKKDLTWIIAFEYITVASFAAVGIYALLGWGNQ